LDGPRRRVFVSRSVTSWWQSRLQKVGEPDVKLNGDHRPSLRCDELEPMLIYSMSVSVDGFIADREGVRVDGP
jgi:hypothetical protein